MITREPMTKERAPFGEAQKHTEGEVARKIEDQTAKVPSDTFLWAAVAAMGASLLLQVSGKKDASNFVGQWVAPFLLFGVYNKIVKVAGSDRIHESEGSGAFASDAQAVS